MADTTCYSRDEIVSNGGSVVQNTDGTVSVYISDGQGGTKPFFLTKTCCNNLGYTFDIETQECYWTRTPATSFTPETCPTSDFKIVLNPKGNDGTIFSENESEDCILEVNFDYLVKFDCSNFSGYIKPQDGAFKEDCDTAIEALESLDLFVTIDTFNDLTGTLTTVYEEQIFNIGVGNLFTYLSGNTTSGLLFCTGDITTDCEPFIIGQTKTGNCATIVTQLFQGLVAEAALEGVSLTQSNLLNYISASALSSNWLSYSTTISDPTLLAAIADKKIKLTIKVNKTCIDVCILLDKIELNRKCSSITKNNVFISHSPSFELERVVDNKKSWVAEEERETREFDLTFRDTEYSINHHKLAINTKEVDLNISSASAIETDVWCYINDNPCILSGSCVESGATTNCGDDRELVVNGSFSSNLSGWSILNDISWGWSSYSGGVASYTGVDEGGTLYQNVLTTGQTYTVAFDLMITGDTAAYSGDTNLGGLTVFIGESSSGFTTTGASFTHYELTMICTGSTQIGFQGRDSNGLGIGIFIDNVSIIVQQDPCINCGDNCVDINDILTTPLSSITTVSEFQTIMESELIDVKSRKTLSAYPTLRLLYDRYINSLDHCATQSSGFNYSSMDMFAGLIGTYWVDLIEQVIPSTTIWGSTYVYGNTVFDKQKFEYRTHTLYTCLLSGATGDTTYIGYEPTVGVELTTYGINAKGNQEVYSVKKCTGVYLKQRNCGSEFLGSVTIIGTNPETVPLDNGVIIINETD